MPLLSELQLPPPKNWQDFESLCRDLWSSLWSDPDAQKNARNGQPQSGVDVFGRPGRGAAYAGVQCKGRDNLLDARVTTGDVTAESLKAESFVPPLQEFSIATTAPRDGGNQKVARLVTIENLKRGKFPVTVWSWEDIAREVVRRPGLLQAHYPELFAEGTRFRIPMPGAVSFDIVGPEPTEEIARLFASPEVRAAMAEELRGDLQSLVTELALNAFEHGRARWCSVQIERTKCVFSDDGARFDPVSAAPRPAEGRRGVGLEFFRRFAAHFKDSLSCVYSYDEQNGRNQVTFQFASPLSSLTLVTTCRIRLRQRYWPGVSVRQVAEIPEGCSTYHLSVGPDSVAVSHVVELIEKLLEILPAKSDLVVAVHWGAVFRDVVRMRFSAEPRVVVV